MKHRYILLIRLVDTI